MQITETIKNIDLTNVDVAKLGDRVEQFSHTAADSYAETSVRVIDAVVDANKKVVDVVVDVNDKLVERLPEAPFADRMPTVAEAGERYLEFVERAADFNRDLNRRVVDFLPTTPVKATKKAAASKK